MGLSLVQSRGVRKRILRAVRGIQSAVRDGAGSGVRSEFVKAFFDSPGEYERYTEEFDRGPASTLRNEGLERYQQLTGTDTFGGIGLDVARTYYAIVRAVQPRTVVETGVCNGVSTLAVLLALRENGSGSLHSIDYPFRADESLDEFKRETFEGYGGAAIPSDRQPGWIIPDELRPLWELTVGKSQRELPRLLLEVDHLNLFVHDSEHSHPCMMFEYELAYEWLADGGVLLSDDITWNDAFSVFTDVRGPEHGRVSDGVGYVLKPEADD